MTRTFTLTGRVTVALAGIVALFVGLVVVLAISILHEQEDELANQLVQVEMRRLIERLDSGEFADSLQPLLLGPDLQAWIHSRLEAGQAIPEALRELASGPHELRIDSTVMHVLSADTDTGRITMALDATSNEQRVNQFGMILGGIWLFCVAIGYWLARSIARVVVAPIREVTDRIAGWDPDSTHASRDSSAVSDEAERMLAAFTRMQDRVDRSIAREREFAANVSHEVRTPLTALRTDIELASLDPHNSVDQVVRFERMMRAIDDVGRTIDSARAVSNPRTSVTRQTFALDRLIDDVWGTLAERAVARGLRLHNAVPSGHSACADRYALLIVLRNLIGNAIDHAAPAKLTVSLEHSTLVLVDDGPGIAAAELPFVFDRYHHGRFSDDRAESNSGGDPQHGLGLAIARRICDQQGWIIAVRSSTDGVDRGTRFELHFDGNST